MGDFEKLIADQQTIGTLLESMIRNFKKDSPDRKTQEYAQKKLEILTSNWLRFDRNHETISNLVNKDESHSYFVSNYINQVKLLYESFREKLVDLIDDPSSLTKITERAPSTTNTNEDGEEKIISEDVPTRMQKEIIPGTSGKSTIYSTIPSNNTNNSHDTETEMHMSLLRTQRSAMNGFLRILNTIPNNLNKNPTKVYCNQNLNTISNYWIDIVERHRLIMSWRNQYDYQVEYFYNLEDQHQNILIAIQEYLENISTTDNNNINSPIVNNKDLNIKLPVITIPTFNGEFGKWKPFQDLFQQVIHNQQISKAEKMFYLKANLTGEPSALIKHLQATHENYDTAWQLLNDRYDNKRLLINSLLNDLINQPVLQAESASGLKKLHDTSMECLHAIKNFGIPMADSDFIILHILVKKLDKESRRFYEQTLTAPREIQTLEHFFEFLVNRFQTLESVQTRDDKKKHVSLFASKAESSCPVCRSSTHKIFKCPNFLKLTADQRLHTTKKLQLCINCLKHGHYSSTCTSGNCYTCKGKHNTLLHIAASTATQSNGTKTKTISNKKESLNSTSGGNFSGTSRSNGSILLATAIVNAKSRSGLLIPCRILLDSGSQLNFITSEFAQQLGAKKFKTEIPIRGIGDTETQVTHKINVEFQSKIHKFSAKIEAHVLPKISGYHPHSLIDSCEWAIPNSIELVLADPRFAKPQKIDMLIGAELYFDILTKGKYQLAPQLPTLQNSKLGWLIAGKTGSKSYGNVYCNIATQQSIASLEREVKKFWELEQYYAPTSRMTQEEFQCEEFFNKTTVRDSRGKFIVKLPFKIDPESLGSSKQMAIKRFFALEKKLEKNIETHSQYSEFMEEYEKLDHMEQIENNKLDPTHFFLPHHCVFKLDSSTTKLRVVFDGSAKTSAGNSLNSILMKGPVIQPDLFSIITRFRINQYAFTADISKMYRRILVAPEDRKFQQILWRSNKKDPLKTYQLNTVTYGTTTAPYLATRCLIELAKSSGQSHPHAAQIIHRDMYVDDCLSGGDSIISTKKSLQELIELLGSADFKLHKFCSNDDLILANIPTELHEQFLNIGQNELIKTLGLMWKPKEDSFHFHFTSRDYNVPLTKRIVLSDLAKFFDPLGLIGPVIVYGKIFLQDLWKINLGWDEILPCELKQKWSKYMYQLQELSSISVPRCLVLKKSMCIQLHAFSDSSISAYGACCYMRSVDNQGQILVRLICSKSRVAPLKFTSIARLELQAAVLMTELIERILNILTININKIFYYTDSTTVLAWINSPSYTWATYVAHRVSKIQELTRIEQWRHIDGKENPADIISRGCLIKSLTQSKLWFSGPAFLVDNEENWTSRDFQYPQEMPEQRAPVCAFIVSNREDLISTISFNNSFLKLQRIMSYVFRFISNCKATKNQLKGVEGSLTQDELNGGLQIIIRNIQYNYLSNELDSLRKNKNLDSKNSISSLSPFFDTKTLCIRVGGRLSNSNVSEDTKHQFLLPKNHMFSQLVMNFLHLKNMHAAPQALLALSRERFWIIDARRLARKTVNNCIRCFKVKPREIGQLMGQLPASRVRPSRPFQISGVDFCGPIKIHYKIRGKKSTKCYIAVFICFSTKAVHLELVEDLTARAFINALKRFIGRRGLCETIFCDNATNFVGAKSELSMLKEMFASQQLKTSLEHICQENSIQWRPIPPRSPHFGGLWEAAVKSAKYHLVRYMGIASLTYEELNTVLIQIEAILNSRPLTPLSSDPNDLEALTPGHFLIGAPLTSFAEPNVTEENLNTLNKFRQIQQIQQIFWKRWSLEYLHLLQGKTKWTKEVKNIEPGTLVLLKDQNAPPLRWHLGRVIETFEGRDKLTRVVNVKTASGCLKRAIHNVCPLPVTPTADSSTETIAPPTGKLLRSGKVIKASSVMLMTLLVMLIVPSLAFNITSFVQPPGIYFEDIGQVQSVNNEWNILVYYNLSSYWQEYRGLVSFIDKIEGICETDLIHYNYCNATSTELLHRLKTIAHNNELLHLINGNSNYKQRKSRSPLNVVGWAAHGLFGILDQDYADNIERKIENVNKNENHLLELIKNQTSITDSTLNILKKNTKDINLQFESLTKHYLEAQSMLTSTAVINSFNSLVGYVTLIITNYENTQRELLDVLLDIHHSKMSPNILTPEQLEREITLIRNNIPSTLTIPGNGLMEIYKRISVMSRVTDKTIIFKVNIPLPDNEVYQLFHIVPVPIVTLTQSVIITPHSQYLAVTALRDRYFPLSEYDLHKCSIIDYQRFQCMQSFPIYNSNSNTGICEISLLNHKSNAIEECQYKVEQTNSYWIKLHATNSWIFSLNQKFAGNLVCDQTTTTEKITGSGILTLSPPCVLKMADITLKTKKSFTSHLERSFVPSSNITAWVQEREKLDTSPSIIAINTSTIEKLQVQIHKLRQQEKLPTTINNHDIHHYCSIYIMLFIFIIIIISFWFLIRRRNKMITEGSKPCPQPRKKENFQINENI